MHLHFIQHVSFEWPGSIIDWALEKGHEVSFTKIFEEAKFPAQHSFDMLVVMGGPMGVYEENVFEWMKEEKKFIKQTIDEGKKVLGICLGSQLVAEALGAKVYKHRQNEIGWFEVFKNEPHTVTKNLPDAFTTFHWHGDTFDLPDGATQLFGSKACSRQGFIFNDNVMALQFHPEINRELLYSMTEHERHELIKDVYVQTEDEIKMMGETYLPEQKQLIFLLLDNFI